MENDQILLPGIFSGLGIRSMVFENKAILMNPAPDQKSTKKETSAQNGWRLFIQNHSLGSLWQLFGKCRVIIFTDWASLTMGTDIWDGLLSDVIRPLQGKDRAFIFQLGDIAAKKLFDVDEILDIISDFSLHGKVSLILDEQEAASLYGLLHGAQLSPVVGQYKSIFLNLRIDQLMVCTNATILVYQQDQQFEITVGAGSSRDTALQAATSLSSLK